MRKEKHSNSVGIGFWGILTIVFITLKLTKVIHWSWLWVMAPLWLPTALAIVILIIYLITLSIAKRRLMEKRKRGDWWE